MKEIENLVEKVAETLMLQTYTMHNWDRVDISWKESYRKKAKQILFGNNLAIMTNITGMHRYGKYLSQVTVIPLEEKE